MSGLTRSLGILLVLATLATARPAAAQNLSFGNELPTKRMLDRYNLTRAWWSQATLNPERDTVRYLTADEDMLFVQSTSGAVTAFDLITGKKLWAVQLGRRDAVGFPPTTNDRHVLIAVGLKLYAINKWSGQSDWTITLPATPSSSPVTDEDSIYIGALDGSMYALNLRKIEELYNEGLLPQWSYLTNRWRYKTAKTIKVPAVSTGPFVFFASQDSSLYAVDSGDRTLRFQLETDAPISAPLAWNDNGYLYMASEDFYLYCVNTTSGQIRWEFVAGLPIRQAPRLIGGEIFLTPDGGGMFCLTAGLGIQRWWQPRITRFLAATSRNVYGSDELNNVAILSREDGSLLGNLPLRRFTHRLSNDRTDRLFLATDSGLVVCLHEKGLDYPLYHKYPENRPILPGFAPEGGTGSVAPTVDGSQPADSGTGIIFNN